MKRTLLITVTIILSSMVVSAEESDWESLYGEMMKQARSQKFDSATIWGERCLETATSIENLPDTAMPTILHRLATCYYEAGQLGTADSLFQQAVSMWEALPSPQPSRLAATLNNLGILNGSRGRYEEAERILLRALNLKRSVDNPNEWSISNTIRNLGGLYTDIAEFGKAERYLKECIAIRTLERSSSHPGTLDAKRTLANAYYYLRRCDEAEDLFVETIIGFREVGDFRGVAGSTIGLIMSYHGLNRLEEAERAALDGLTILDSVSVDKPEIASLLLGNLGMVYLQTNQYQKALEYFERALYEARSIREDDHPDVLRCLHNNARALTYTGELLAADSIFRDVYSHRLRILGDKHTHVASTLAAWSRPKYLQGDIDSAFALAFSAFEIWKVRLRSDLLSLSEQDALRYAARVRWAGHLALSLLMSDSTSFAARHQEITNLVFAMKGAVSDEIFTRHRYYADLSDLDLIGKHQMWIEARANQARLSLGVCDVSAGSVESAELDSLAKAMENLEHDLALAGFENRHEAEVDAIDLQKVTDAVPEGCVLIEYYFAGLPALWPDTISERVLLTLTIDSDGLRSLTATENVETIDSLVGLYRNHMTSLSYQKHLPLKTDLSDYLEIATSLYEHIIKPIEDKLRESDRLIVSPDGVLNLISFGSLMLPDGQYLIENYDIVYVDAARDLIRTNDWSSTTPILTAFGDPDYEASPTRRFESRGRSAKSVELAEIQVVSSRNRAARTWSASAKVPDLPSTRHELVSIGSSWQQSRGVSPELFVGAAASEDNLKSLPLMSRVVHIATHGFYTSDEPEPSSSTNGEFEDGNFERATVNPLLNSGLLLAGCNLHGKGAGEHGVEDGILTSEEVSLLDFALVETVVLSACETGVGDIRDGEGVYGLRRAFRMSGVRNIVNSLWPVDDRTTADLMAPLYASYSGELIGERLIEVQKQYLSQLREAGLCDHPFSWASFVAFVQP